MLRFQDLTKTFRTGVRAVSGVSFSVERGEIFGLLGHNGAGKSTLLAMALGLVRPDAGEVSVDSISVQGERSRALRRIGSVVEGPVFYDYLSGRRNIELVCLLSSFRDSREIEKTVELVGLAENIDRKVGAYSHGMRGRLALAMSLLPRPSALLLDEPMSGLDPQGVKDFRLLIQRLRDELGLTILLNSHMLNEVEQICDRMGILRHGELLYVGDGKDVGANEVCYDIEVEDRAAASAVLEKAGGSWRGDEVAAFPPGVDPVKLLEDLCGAGCRVRKFAPRERKIEEFYLRIAKEEDAR